MIPDKYTEAYRSIKAPESLRERVTSNNNILTARHRVRVMPRILSAAAALVIVFAAVFALRLGRAGANAYISYDGAMVNSPVEINASVPYSISMLIEPRFAAPSGIPLDVNVTGSTTITASVGTLTIFDADGSLKATGSKLMLSESATVYWCVDPFDDFSHTVTLIDEDGEVTYKLSVNSETVFIQKEN